MVSRVRFSSLASMIVLLSPGLSIGSPYPIYSYLHTTIPVAAFSSWDIPEMDGDLSDWDFLPWYAWIDLQSFAGEHLWFYDHSASFDLPLFHKISQHGEVPEEIQRGYNHDPEDLSVEIAVAWSEDFNMGFSQEKVEGHVFRTEDVDKKFKKYTSYGRWRTTHGDCGKNTSWKILEMDPWPNDDDLMGKWYGVNLSGTRNLTAVGEVWLVVRETNEG